MGCATPKQQAAKQSIEDPPVSPSEYPEYEFTQSTYPVSVGVLGAHDRPKKPLLEPLKPIELTEREKEALAAIEKKQSYDALALYPGTRSANILPDLAGPNVGVYGETNASVGLILIPAPAVMNVYEPGSDHESVGIMGPTSTAFHFPTDKERNAGVGPPSEVDVGYIPAQRSASYDPHIERD